MLYRMYFIFKIREIILQDSIFIIAHIITHTQRKLKICICLGKNFKLNHTVD